MPTPLPVLLLLIDAAAALRGNEADSTFTGYALSIDGRDYAHVTTALMGVTQYGLTVPTVALKTTVDSVLSAQQRDNIIGTAGSGTTASIGVSSALPSSTPSSMGDPLCDAAPAANKFTIGTNGTYSPPANAGWGSYASRRT